MPRVLNKYKDAPTDNCVYIGRPSKWGNPFNVEQYGREGAIRRYEEYLDENPQLKKIAKEQLRGKDLMCFCAPHACHGDLLLKIANSD